MSRRFYYGWVIVGVGWLALFASAATAPPVFTLFITPMGREMGWSRTLMAGAVSVGTLATVPILPLVGRWLDRYGARVVVAVAGMVVGGAILSLAWVRDLWGFYIGFGIGRMLDQGVVNISSTTAVSNWFIRKRGRAQAVLNVGRALGSTIMPLVVFFFIRAYGWRSAWLVVGIMVWLVMVMPAALFMKRRPEDIGLRPDGLAPAAESAPAATPTGPLRADPEPVWAVSEAVRTPALWLITGAIFIRGVAAPGVAIHLMPFLLDRGLDPAVAAVAVSLSAAAIGVG
ncbi:MAG: MFS transporter, partial [Chloroflexota bacterium]